MNRWAIAGAAVVALAAALLVARERVRQAAQGSATFVELVRAEVAKVTWPDRLQLRNATGVIIVFVVIVGVVIWVMDVILSRVFVQWLPGFLG